MICKAVNRLELINWVVNLFYVLA